MSTVQLSDALVERIEAAGVTNGGLDAFVEQAVREKLDWESRRAEFYRLSSQLRQAMKDRGITEEEILTEFDSFRRTMHEQPGN
jgi:hypothetical protein